MSFNFLAAITICSDFGAPQNNPWEGKIPLEKELATHSSILAWEIPWTESAGLQSMGLQKSQTQPSYSAEYSN